MKEMRMWKKVLIHWFFILTLVFISLVAALPVFADTDATVTVTATGNYVSYTSNASDYGFGNIDASSTTNSSASYIKFTNASSVSTNISVQMLASAWDSSGTGWTHSDSAAGSNTAAMKACSANGTWTASEFVKYNSPYNEIAQSVAVDGDVLTGLSLLAPTDFDDGYSNNNTVQFNFYSAS